MDPSHAYHASSTSPSFQELQTIFRTAERPYRANDIARFNRLYARIYRSLDREQRREAEAFVDELIAGVEKAELVPTIFGVV